MTSAFTCQPDHTLVIPAYKEGDGFIARLVSQFQNTNTLLVIVLNGPVTASQSDRIQTQAAREWLHQHATLQARHPPEWHLFSLKRLQILCIDLLAAPQTQSGVGFARKFGMDTCLWLYHNQHITHPWVHNTDADAILPEDYFAPTLPSDSASAALYPFRHQPDTPPSHPNDQQESSAAHLYDAWLRYYVEGLKWAESPWAFHTIGSTIAIHLTHYARCRGFPKKEAGEDFYLLNKLAKTGSIITLNHPTLLLSTRLSDRTPFGTGNAIHKMAHRQAQWLFYHPDIFQQLRYFNQQKNRLYTLSAKEWDTLFSDPTLQPIKTALTALDFQKILQHCQQHSHDESGFIRHLDTALDAARTRKIVHWMRNHYFPSLTPTQLLQAIHNKHIAFIQPLQKITDMAQLSRFLYQI